MNKLTKHSTFEELKSSNNSENKYTEQDKKEFEKFLNLLQKNKEEMKRKNIKRKQ